MHGVELTRLGLRTALQTESPAAILQWLERSRAASTRLAAVRPSADAVLAGELSRLRIATHRARLAEMAGESDPELEDEVDRLRRRVRSRSWLVGGSGAVSRPLSLAAVQRRLAEAGGGTGGVSIVAPFRGGGRFHALVITARSARYLRLARDFGLEAQLNRIIGDLNILADHRVLEPLRRVAASSLRTGLDRVAEYIAVPIEPHVADGPVIVAAAGSAAIVPWALLPGLSGRAISVSPSVTAAVAGMGRTSEEFRSGVLAVAGPDVPHGTEEAQAVAEVYVDSPFDGPTELLTGPAATGRAVLDAMPSGGLVHIAAHGHHEPDNPLFSGVLLADGLLYGYDVAPNPALPSQVVLSSCDVGRTDDRPGGEPLGLVAALLRSGVGTVVAGTSRISDRVAAAVMSAYHQRLFKEKPRRSRWPGQSKRPRRPSRTRLRSPASVPGCSRGRLSASGRLPRGRASARGRCLAGALLRGEDPVASGDRMFPTPGLHRRRSSTTVPSTTVSTTVPSTTVPSTTVPSTTVPSTTGPSTTVPSTTVPSTTVLSTTGPLTTVPSTTVSTRTWAACRRAQAEMRRRTIARTGGNSRVSATTSLRKPGISSSTPATTVRNPPVTASSATCRDRAAWFTADSASRPPRPINARPSTKPARISSSVQPTPIHDPTTSRLAISRNTNSNTVISGQRPADAFHSRSGPASGIRYRSMSISQLIEHQPSTSHVLPGAAK